MTYELALELKEAGFPQNAPWFMHDTEGKLNLADPTLSGLSEACGEDFERLEYRRHNKTWASVSTRIMLGGFQTPEEAVAKLWLALHSPKANVI